MPSSRIDVGFRFNQDASERVVRAEVSPRLVTALREAGTRTHRRCSIRFYLDGGLPLGAVFHHSFPFYRGLYLAVPRFLFQGPRYFVDLPSTTKLGLRQVRLFRAIGSCSARWALHSPKS